MEIVLADQLRSPSSNCARNANTNCYSRRFLHNGSNFYYDLVLKYHPVYENWRVTALKIHHSSWEVDPGISFMLLGGVLENFEPTTTTEVVFFDGTVT